MPIDVSEEILSPPGMFEGVGQQMMELVIIGVERVNIVVVVVFEFIPLIFFNRKVASFMFDGLKFSNMLLVLKNLHQLVL